MQLTSYQGLIDALKSAYPGYDITMGSTNVLKAPAIIIQLADIEVANADDDIFGVVDAQYVISFYVETTAQFNPWPAAHMFGNLSQVDFDQVAKGELFQSNVQITGAHCLWDYTPGGD